MKFIIPVLTCVTAMRSKNGLMQSTTDLSGWIAVSLPSEHKISMVGVNHEGKMYENSTITALMEGMTDPRALCWDKTREALIVSDAHPHDAKLWYQKIKMQDGQPVAEKSPVLLLQGHVIRSIGVDSAGNYLLGDANRAAVVLMKKETINLILEKQLWPSEVESIPKARVHILEDYQKHKKEDDEGPYDKYSGAYTDALIG